MITSVKQFFLVALLAASTAQAAESSYMPDLSKLSNLEKAELAAAFARGSMGATNGYALHTNSSYKNITEICAKITTIIHDSLNVYNIKNKGEKNIHQIGRLIHDSSSLLYEASKMLSNTSGQTTSCPFTAAHINELAVLHYILPLVEAAAGGYIVTSATDNSAHARKNRALAQGMLSLAHYIDDASKANGDILVLYPRITLALGSLAALSYDFSRDDAAFKKEEKKADKKKDAKKSDTENSEESEESDETTKETDNQEEQDSEESEIEANDLTGDAEEDDNDTEGEESEDSPTSANEDDNTEDSFAYEDYDDSSFVPESDNDMEEDSDSEDDSSVTYPERIFKDTDTKGSAATDAQTRSRGFTATPPLTPEASDDEEEDESAVDTRSTANYEEEVEAISDLTQRIKFIGKKTRGSQNRFVPTQHKAIIDFVQDLNQTMQAENWLSRVADQQQAVCHLASVIINSRSKTCIAVQGAIKELHKMLYTIWQISSVESMDTDNNKDLRANYASLAHTMNDYLNNLMSILQDNYGH